MIAYFPFSPFSLLEWHDQGSHFGHDKRRQVSPTVAGSLGNIFSFCHVGLKISGVTPVFAPARFPFGEGIALTKMFPRPHWSALARVHGQQRWVDLEGATVGAGGGQVRAA
uniref:Uncharacterized protein n=1 Tax=Anopheles atroparvus TaxID=41427 RepID=A0A182JB00_ANOAO